MKEFGDWFKGSDEEHEDEEKPIQLVTPGNPAATLIRTAAQIRSELADLLVPCVGNEEEIEDWMEAFAVGYTRTTNLHMIKLGNIIGNDLAHEYCQTNGTAESMRWWNDFRDKIDDGTLLGGC